MSGFYEYTDLQSAQARHAELTSLGWRPFSIFRTAQRTWGFHVA